MMVEFGLKLQDNQVAEWSNHYINYELLKQVLERSKQTIQKYQEQAKKKPELAQAIKYNFDRGLDTYITTTPPRSTERLSGLVKELSSLSSPSFEKEQVVGTGSLVVNETTGLLTAAAPGGITSSSSVSNVLGKAVSSVSGYFEKRYEQLLRDTLAEMAAQEVEFDTHLMHEVGFLHACACSTTPWSL